MHQRLLMIGLLTAGLTLAVPAVATAAPVASPATTSQSPRVTTLTTGVTLPFGLAVNRGRVYVADGATSTVSRIRSDGSLATVAQGAQGPNHDVAGLAFSRNGRTLAYTTSTTDDSGEQHTAATLEVRGPYGAQRSVDLFAYETKANPDGRKLYGVPHPSDCVAKALEPFGGANYRGQVDSHPYAVAAWGKSSWIVADAGGNDLLKVDGRGRVSTVAVLPRQPYTITAAGAAALGLPDCTIGVTYNFESVPTGVEVGRDGWLYVSVLAGGPEDPSLGARSKVYRVNPRSGRTQLVARGLSGATNLALGSHGRIYVTEYYSGEVSEINRQGRVRTLAEVPRAVSIARSGHRLYVGTTAEFGPNGPSGTGSVVKISS